MPHLVISDRARTNARSLRRGMTDAERRIWSRLRAHRFVCASFRRQVPIGSYIVDFVSFDARLIIEIDGSQHVERKCDRVRDAWLRTEGFSVLRFWNNDVFANLNGILETIAGALSRTVPPSLTLPRKGGGNAL